MNTVENYLSQLYGQVKPNHVVEIGADPGMKIIARTGLGIPKISVVDFEKNNTYKAGWWDMHRSMGINLERVDGDARNLSCLIPSADLIYSQAVLYSMEEGADIRKHLAHRRGEIKLSKADLSKLEEGFGRAESKAIEEACKVAHAGHIVWFTYSEGDEFFKQVNQEQKRNLITGKLLTFSGENPGNEVYLYHLGPSSL